MHKFRDQLARCFVRVSEQREKFALMHERP